MTTPLLIPRNTNSDEVLIAPGTQIKNYKVVRPIGRGDDATVFLAIDVQAVSASTSTFSASQVRLMNHDAFNDTNTNSNNISDEDVLLENVRKVAIKVIPIDSLKTEKGKTLFQRELDIMSQLRHENLVWLQDFFNDERFYYMVLDYCAGGNLASYIIANGRLDEKSAANIFRQVVEAVNYCHSQKVAHRDLKPSNILFSDRNSTSRVKITDFGMCNFIDSDKLMRTMCGTQAYCAPECLCKVQYNGESSDLWSLGVILYVLVMGKLPWSSKHKALLVKQIMTASYTPPESGTLSRTCEDLIKRLLKVNPAERLTPKQILAHKWMKSFETNNNNNENNDIFNHNNQNTTNSNNNTEINNSTNINQIENLSADKSNDLSDEQYLAAYNSNNSHGDAFSDVEDFWKKQDGESDLGIAVSKFIGKSANNSRIVIARRRSINGAIVSPFQYDNNSNNNSNNNTNNVSINNINESCCQQHHLPPFGNSSSSAQAGGVGANSAVGSGPGTGVGATKDGKMKLLNYRNDSMPNLIKERPRLMIKKSAMPNSMRKQRNVNHAAILTFESIQEI